jgi:hypothetical protein
MEVVTDSRGIQIKKRRKYYNPSDLESKIIKLPHDTYNLSTLLEACDDRICNHFQVYGITIPFSIRASKINIIDEFQINSNYNINGNFRENDINRDAEVNFIHIYIYTILNPFILIYVYRF